MNTYSSTSNSWSEIPYPGRERVSHGVEPGAGGWPLYYLKRDDKGNFLSPTDERIALAISNPCIFNFEAELAEVEKVQREITPDQIHMANYWATGTINRIAPLTLLLSSTYKLSPVRAARVMAAVANTLNDASIVTFYYKYLWDYPRPCQLNPNLKTVLATPMHPTYPSGHSVGLSAALAVLSYYFPGEACKLNQLVEDASISRLYGGIHFRSDLTEGLRLGRFIGKTIIKYLKNQEDGDHAMVDFPRTDFLDAPITPVY